MPKQIDQELEHVLQITLGNENAVLAFCPAKTEVKPSLLDPKQVLILAFVPGFVLVAQLTDVFAFRFVAIAVLLGYVFYLGSKGRNWLVAVTATHLALVRMSGNYQRSVDCQRYRFEDIAEIIESGSADQVRIELVPREGKPVPLLFHTIVGRMESATGRMSEVLSLLRERVPGYRRK